jgi:carbamoyltransferase
LNILGLSAYYHDSAAALVRDGEIVGAAQEERFSRKKHDARFPEGAIRSCLEQGNIALADVDEVVFYDKPLVKFERLLETYLTYAPQGFRSFVAAMPVWLKEKLYLKATLKRELAALGGLKEKDLPKLLFAGHHQSHAASAFYPSPYEKAAVMCLDGVGEWATTSIWLGEGHALTPQWELDFPHSLGMLYSAFTYYTGFRVNSGEYKLMGLAPYGEPKYVDLILEHLIDLKADGTFRLNMEYFNYATGLTMTNKRFADLFGAPARTPETQIAQKEMDIARSIQEVTEEVVLRLARTVHQELDCEYLCLAGGVALNCVANGRILREGPFRDIWIQPAAGDAGGALGAALVAWHEYHDQPRQVNGHDRMSGSYLGPRYQDTDIRTRLDGLGAVYERLDDEALLERLSGILADEKVVGWFQGRMEFGPRSLGGRSIIGDPRSAKMQSVDEPEDQVPGVVPSVCPGGAGGGCVGVFRAGPAEPVHADCGAGAGVAAGTDDGGAAAAVRDREAECAALAGTGDHPRGLLGTGADGAREEQPAVSRAAAQVQGAYRVQCAGEYLVQCARGADRVYAGGCLPLFHAHGDGLPGGGELPAGEAGSAGVGEGRVLDGRV